MMIMPALRKYPQELRDRAVRLVYEARKEDPELSLNAAVVRVGQRTGVKADTLRGWSKQASIDAGERPGVTSSDAVRIKALEAEVKELKRVPRSSRGSSTRDFRGDLVHR
jgi:transposase